MRFRYLSIVMLTAVMGACAAEQEEMPEEEMAMEEMPAEEMAVADISTDCAPMTGNMALDGRASPYDSTMVEIGGATAKVCYGRPSMRDREILGGLVPYDTLWRTGANEPTTIHIPFEAEIAGIAVEPGAYSLYTVPGEDEWTVIVNRSTSQWGIESAYTEEVRSQEVGRAQVPAAAAEETVETFTIETEPAGANTTHLVLEWEDARVEIPIVRS